MNVFVLSGLSLNAGDGNDVIVGVFSSEEKAKENKEKFENRKDKTIFYLTIKMIELDTILY